MQVYSTVSTSGFRVTVKTQCRRQVTSVWCPKSALAACSTPPTTHDEEVNCPHTVAFRGVKFSLRTPWGHVYVATSDPNGGVLFPVDWTGTGIDPLAKGADDRLATGWQVYSDDGRSIPLELQPGDVEQMKRAIGAATDRTDEVGAANEKASLSAELADGAPLVVGATGSIGLAITNKGPQPAYRVMAKLRSSVDALHGHQLAFGRIDPGTTKHKMLAIAIPPKLDERSALVVAEITYFNGDPIETRRKLVIAPEPKRVAPPRGLALDCKLASPEVAPGERVRITCELRNLGNDPAKDLGITVTVASEASKNLAPKSLPGAGTEKLELIGLTPPSEQQGAKLPVLVRATALGVPPVEWAGSVGIASLATRCKARLTRDEYKTKLKKLQAALASGALTQKELDKYDADLVSCLQ
jgi:hypothetical protein